MTDDATEPRRWYKSVITAVTHREGSDAAAIQIALTGGWLSVPWEKAHPQVGDPVYWRGTEWWSRHLVIGECEVWNEYAEAR